MRYEIKYLERVLKDVRKLDNVVQKQVKKALEKIAVNPDMGKPLEYEFKDLRSYRTGNYRIIYKIFNEEIYVLVVAIGHRRDVYDRLRKLLNR